jgi:hypothetical protein
MANSASPQKPKKGSNFYFYACGLPLAIVVSLIYLPQFWIYVFMTVDFLTPWKIFESPAMIQYHQFLVGRLPERPELPLPELHYSNYSVEEVFRLSKHYTFPIVIRGLIANSTGVGKWSDKDWWLANYANEQILCGTLDFVRPTCTIKDFFDELAAGNPFYITGASKIFGRHPELAAMVDVPGMDKFEPGPRVSTQIFMGLKNMGSDIHAAIGVNL